MAGALLSSLLIELAADVAKFESDMGRAQRIADQKLAAITSSAKKAGLVIGTALAAGAVALAVGVARTVAEMDKIGDASQRLNIGVESLTALGYAADQSGSSMETLQAGLGKLNKVLGEAVRGNDAAAALFESLGVKIEGVGGKAITADVAFLKVAQSLSQIQDPIERASVAMLLFGQQAGPELAAFVSQGEAGIVKLMEEAARLGVVMDETAVQGASKLKDNLDTLSRASDAFFLGLTEQVVPALQLVVDGMMNAEREGEGMRELGESVGKAFRTLGAVVVGAAGGFELLVLGSQAFKAASVGNIEALARLNAEMVATRARTQETVDKLLGLVAAGSSVAASNIKVGGSVGKLSAEMAKFLGVSEKNRASHNAQVDALARARTALENHAQIVAEAASREKAMADAVDKLTFALRRNFEEGLRPAYTAMQEFSVITGEVIGGLVQDIPLVVRGMEDLGASVGTMSATATVEMDAFAENWQGMVDASTDAFADFIAGGMDSFDDFGKSLQRIAQQFLSNLIKQFLQTNLNIGSVTVPGQGAGSGSFLSAGAGSLGFVGAGAALGYQRGGPVGAVAGGAIGLGLYGAAAGAGGLGLGIGAGSAAAAAGAAAGGGVAGGLAGASAALGPVGWAVLAAAALYTIFRTNKPPDVRVGGASANVRNPEEQFATAFGPQQVGTRELLRSDFITAITNFDAAIAQIVGATDGGADQLTAISARLSTWSVDLRGSAATAENVLGSRFDAILSTFDQSTQDFVNAADTIEERVARLAEFLERPMRIQGVLDALADEELFSGMTDTERQLYDIGQRFDALRASLEEWGASETQLAELEIRRAAAIDRVNTAIEDNLRNSTELANLMRGIEFDRVTRGISDYQRQLMDLNRTIDDTIQRAMALGASEEDLAAIRAWGQQMVDDAYAAEQARIQREIDDAAAEAQRAMEDYWAEVQRAQADAARAQEELLRRLREQAMSLQAWLDRQTQGSTSTLNPMQRLGAAQDSFNAALQSALTGPADSVDIGALTGAADGFLQQAQSFYGPSGQYAAIEAQIRAQIAAVMMRFGVVPRSPFNAAAGAGVDGVPAANSSIVSASAFNTDATLRDVREAVVSQGNRIVSALQSATFASRQG